MPKIKDMLRARLLKDVPNRSPDLDSIRRHQRCADFEKLRSNRMVFGAMRYGLISKNSGKDFDSIGSIITRANKFKKDGNIEHLVDIANLAMVEFVRARTEIQPVDDGDHHVERL